MKIILAFLLATSSLSAQIQGAILTGTFGSSGSQAATPTFSPVAGTISSGTTITISTATSGCSSYIYWSFTHNPPTVADSNSTTSSPITTNSTLYAKVIGCPGHSDSAVGSASYTVSGGSTITLLAAGNCISSGGIGGGCDITSITWSSGTPALVVVGISSTASSQQIGSPISDSAGNFYPTSSIWAGGSTNSNQMWYAGSGTGGSWTPPTSGFTVHCAVASNTYPSCFVFVFAGASGSLDLASSGAYSTAAQTLTPGSITPGSNSEVVIGLCSVYANGVTYSVTSTPAFTIPTNGQLPGSSGAYLGGAMYYDAQSAATAVNPQCNSNTGSNTDMATITASFK